MKKVLHILNELKPSGAEVMLNSSFMYWKDQGFQSEILSTGYQLGNYAENLKKSGYKIHHIPYKTKFGFIKNVFRFLKINNYDVIHIHTERANFVYSILSKAVKAPSIVRTIHSCFLGSRLGRRKRTIERLLVKKLGIKQISIGPSVTKAEQINFNNKTNVILNWYDSNRFCYIDKNERTAIRNQLSIDSDTFMIVSVGNCSDIKNHKEIIKSLSLLPLKSNFIYFHIGQEEKHMSERLLVKELGLENKVKFLGYIEDVRPYLWSSDAYVMPSLHEGLSIAALEALATGANCIFSDTQGLQDFKRYCSNINWVKPNANDISKSIITLMQKTKENRLKDAYQDAAKLKEVFGIERGVTEYIKIYNGELI